MKYRSGSCASCAAEYRVPASFQADRAKCKACGGVVELGPVQGADDAPAAKPATPRPTAESRPAVSPAPSPRPVPAAKPTPRPAAPAATKPAAPKPTVGSKPTASPNPTSAPKPAAPKVASAAAGAASAGLAKAAAGAKKAVDPVRAAAESAASRVKSAPALARRPAARDDDDDEDESPARSKRGAGKGKARRAPAKKKSLAMPLAATLAVLAGLGGGGYWLYNKSTANEAKAAEKSAAIPDDASSATASESASDGAVASDATQQAAGASPAVPAGQDTPPVEEAKAETPAASVAAGAAAADAKPSADSKEASAKASEVSDTGDEVDLSVYEDLGKLPGTSADDWSELQGLVATFLDPSAGAKGNRAKGKLEERGREAFPAILNAMKRLDFSTDEGKSSGDIAQHLLMDICHGQNFGWYYTTEPKDVRRNKRVVELWIKAWQINSLDYKKWAKMTKISEEEALELFAKTGPFDGAAPASEEKKLDDF